MTGALAGLVVRFGGADWGKPVGLREYRGGADAVMRRELAAFLCAHGDDLPKTEVRKSVAGRALSDWIIWLDDLGVAATMRAVQNDWYLCTMKNAAVRPDLRGRGIGRALYRALADRALSDPDRNCAVLAADVTTTNIASIRALESAGFRRVQSFCWARGQQPADVMHFVRTPVEAGGCGALGGVAHALARGGRHGRMAA